MQSEPDGVRDVRSGQNVQRGGQRGLQQVAGCRGRARQPPYETGPRPAGRGRIAAATAVAATVVRVEADRRVDQLGLSKVSNARKDDLFAEDSLARVACL